MRTGFTRALVAVSVGLAACGGVGYGSPNGSGNNTGTINNTPGQVSVKDNAFTPSSATVATGATVTWTWGGVLTHNVTFDDGPSSGDKSTGSYQRTFNAQGTYNYHCTIHGTAMSGKVVVQ